ncbi:YlaI family protein [Thalassorhabdus alkalitolerans]|uniref:YlaI family protein n=1 Tax=Thalassorhabdus alkalitolerans TaxID=2282697 RepID=A0ABW0YJL1_9BACI|nr:MULTISPECIES: YlaI family protein [Bacillaceae]
MKVKCVICDTINDLKDDSPLAKRLRNRPIHTYMCDPCHERISEKTNERWASGNFTMYQSKTKEDNWK